MHKVIVVFVVFVTVSLMHVSSVTDGNLNPFYSDNVWAMPYIANMSGVDLPIYVELDNKTNSVYVINEMDSTVSVIDRSTKEVVDAIWFGSLASGVQVNPLTNSVYVVNTQDDAVYIIDRTENKLQDAIKIDTNSAVTGSGDSVNQSNDTRLDSGFEMKSVRAGSNLTTNVSNDNEITTEATATLQENNTKPNATNDSVTTSAGFSLVDIDVLENDTSTEITTLTIVDVSSPSNGTALINSTSTGINYTVDSGFIGIDSFNYTISDREGKNDTATVTVHVLENNTAPVAKDDFVATQPGVTLQDIPVLENDTDTNTNALFITSITASSNGTATINATSTGINYTSDLNFTGMDTLNYTLSDGNGGFDNARLTIEVVEADNNTKPHAMDDFMQTIEGVPLNNINVLGNDTDSDGDMLTIVKVSSPRNGTAVINATSTGINYTSDQHFTGMDSFNYTVSDGNGGNDTATVIVEVLEGNTPPDASDDSVSTTQGVSLTDIGVLANDTDSDGDPLRISAISNPENGSTSINATSTGINYTSDVGFIGIDSFNYTISDGGGGFDNGTVIVNVLASDGEEGDDLEDDLSVIVEIKPGKEQDEPKPINLRSRGVIPVAILSTATMDATTVIPSSIEFGNGEAGIAHRFPHVGDVNGDGFDDLVVHFWTQQVEIDDDADKICLEAETEGGSDIEGCDSIRTVPAVKIQKTSSTNKAGPPPHAGKEPVDEKDRGQGKGRSNTSHSEEDSREERVHGNENKQKREKGDDADDDVEDDDNE